MRSEEKMLLLLRGADRYAHISAKEMKTVLESGKRNRVSSMLKIADRHFGVIMQVFSVEHTAMILKTWLSVYQLPLDATRLKTFDIFHATYGSWILKNAGKIKGY